MAAGTVDLRAECSVFIAFNDAVLVTPETGLVEVVRLLDIRELTLGCLRLGTAHEPPEEGNHLGSGTNVRGLEDRLVIVTLDYSGSRHAVSRSKPEILGICYILVE